MYYRIDIYMADGTWQEWTTGRDKENIRNIWQNLIDTGQTCRVCEVRDITSGNRWID